MKADTQLTTQRLILRHWQDNDLDALWHLNNDPRVMKFFPFRRTREQTRELLQIISDDLNANGTSWAAITLRESGDIIGFAGLAKCHHNQPFEPAVEIGWRLMPKHWSKGYASEAARALLSQGFETMGLDKIVSFAVHNNYASRRVMERIGMVHDARFDFEMPGIDDTHRHLWPHAFYAITKAQMLNN